MEKFLARQPEWRQLREQTGRSFEQLPLGIKRDYGRLRIGLSWMQQGVADSSKTLLAWAPIPLRKLEPCIPSQSSQQNQGIPWISKVDLPPPLDRSVSALVSSASQARSVGQSGGRPQSLRARWVQAPRPCGRLSDLHHP